MPPLEQNQLPTTDKLLLVVFIFFGSLSVGSTQISDSQNSTIITSHNPTRAAVWLPLGARD